MTQEFLITVQTDQATRFIQDPEQVRSDLQFLAQKLLELRTQGRIPVVTAVTVNALVLAERMQKLLDETPEADLQRAIDQGEPFWKMET